MFNDEDINLETVQVVQNEEKNCLNDEMLDNNSKDENLDNYNDIIKASKPSKMIKFIINHHIKILMGFLLIYIVSLILMI